MHLKFAWLFNFTVSENITVKYFMISKFFCWRKFIIDYLLSKFLIKNP